jgi:hypothetical protein
VSLDPQSGTEPYSPRHLRPVPQPAQDTTNRLEDEMSTDGLKHCVVIKHIESGYVTMTWIYDDLDWARWKVAEHEHICNRRERVFAYAIVSI